MGKYEIRIHRNMDIILSFLEKNNLKASFCCWMDSKKYPSIIKKIDSLGYEVGSHTNMHQLMYKQSYKEVDEDLKLSINYLEDITGKKVYFFRAPGFSITEKNKWVFEILSNNGITHDSSIFPTSRAHGGFNSFLNDKPLIISYNGLEIKEFPINLGKFFFVDWVFSGGGYFRLSPYFLINYYTKISDYVMTYFHPRDFDYNQPIIKELSLFENLNLTLV